MLTVDVIIPVYKPTTKLRSVLQAIEKQSYKAQKVFLMHTEDGTSLRNYIPESGQVPIDEILIELEDFDHGKTRDEAVRKSEADVVICMTQDAVPADRYLFEHLMKELQNDPEIATAYARQLPGKNSGFIEAYTREFNYPETSRIKMAKDLEILGIKTYFCSNVCAAYRREIYEKLGGFEKNIIFNEDMVYAAKAINHGYKIAYTADAKVIHSHHYSGRQQIKRNFDLGVSQACYPKVFEQICSETEGIQLVQNTAAHLLKIKKPHALIELFVQSGCKYIGYRLGKNYKRLPRWMVMKLTMNQRYWKKRRETYGPET